MKLTEREKQEALDVFRSIQARLASLLEELDGTSRTEGKSWTHQGTPASPYSSTGTSHLFRGAVVEKAASSVAAVTGDHYPTYESEHQGPSFWVASLLTCCHMYNPHAPSAFLSLELFQVGEKVGIRGATQLGASVRYEDDLHLFNDAMREACVGCAEGDYERFKEQSSQYFFLPHWQESCGVGGLSFDDPSGDFASHLSFLDAVSRAFLKSYQSIMKRRVDTPFSDVEKDRQWQWRGRLAEFLLVYDRSANFALKTFGNPEAVLAVMPPVVKW